MGYGWVATRHALPMPESNAIGSHGPLDEDAMDWYEYQRRERQDWNERAGFAKYPMPRRTLEPTFEQYAEIGWAMGPNITASTSHRLLDLMRVENDCQDDWGIVVKDAKRLAEGCQRLIDYGIGGADEYYVASILRVAQQAAEWNVPVVAM